MSWLKNQSDGQRFTKFFTSARNRRKGLRAPDGAKYRFIRGIGGGSRGGIVFSDGYESEGPALGMVLLPGSGMRPMRVLLEVLLGAGVIAVLEDSQKRMMKMDTMSE